MICFLFIVVFRFEIIREGILSGVGGSKRALNRVLKALHKELAEHWYRGMLRQHFDPGASQRYGYQERSDKYRKRKERLFERGKAEAPDTDLVLTGLTEESVKEYVNIRAYPTRFSATMHGPRYVSMRPYKSGHPNMGEEITAIDAQDDRELGVIASKRLPLLIKREDRSVRGRERV